MSDATAPEEILAFWFGREGEETISSQDLGVACFERLAREAPAAHRAAAEGYVRFAEEHRAIVRRFGHFPHRNAALGRRSTAEEEAFLQGGGSTFGQG